MASFKVFFLIVLCGVTAEDAPLRTGRLFSLFNVVRFRNDECGGVQGLSGGCFSEAECAAEGGTPAGGCANGQ